MIEIIIKNVGDTWSNQDEVQQSLRSVSAQDLVVFKTLEGPSMHQLGLIDFVQNWASKTQHPYELIKIKSINTYEKIPFENIISYLEAQNSTWSMSVRYWNNQYTMDQNYAYLFGLFLGRRETARNVIMYQCFKSWSEYFLFSQTNNYSTPTPWELDPQVLDPWLSKLEQTEFIQWYDQKIITSIDQVKQEEQFANGYNTNASLLEHYYKFGLELVCETCTMGTAFFPTEKIVRPIVGLKPFLVYATKNYLQHLRNLGYQTFESLWNEDYDNLEGRDRWLAIKNIISTIITNPELIKACEPIVQHNKKNLETHLRNRKLL